MRFIIAYGVWHIISKTGEAPASADVGAKKLVITSFLGELVQIFLGEFMDDSNWRYKSPPLELTPKQK